MKKFHSDKINSIKVWICRFIANQTNNLTDNKNTLHPKQGSIVNKLEDKNICNAWVYKDYNLKLI